MAGLIPKFTSKDIEAMINQRMQRINAAYLMRLKRVGEKFVTNARLHGDYKDQTGNLRSSIGYIILKDGVQLEENIKGGKSVGQAKAKAVLDEVKLNYPLGYVLIVVAGMDYAAAVESKGRDVLTASSLTAKQELQKAINDLKTKVDKMK